MKLGFIGLGIMGTPMAGHLLAAGHALFVHTRRAVPPALLDAGAYGVICPMVNSRDEAAKLVSYTRYAPRGVRWATAFSPSVPTPG